MEEMKMNGKPTRGTELERQSDIKKISCDIFLFPAV